MPIAPRRRRRAAGPTASPAATSTAQPSPAEWPFLGWSRLRVGGTDIGLVTSDCLQPQRQRRALAADAAAQPEHGLGRRRPAHLCRPRPAHRPGRPPLRLRRSASATTSAKPTCAAALAAGRAAARRLRPLRGHGPAGLGTGAAARPLGPGDAAQRRRRAASPIPARTRRAASSTDPARPTTPAEGARQ